MNQVIKRALEIAKKDLRANYGTLGIYAGQKNHREYWSRDSFFATYGACAIEDFEIVRKNLDLFRRYQRENGQIPLRVEDRNHALNFIHLKVKYDPPVARFRSSQPWADEVVDASALYIIAACEYTNKSGDEKWMALAKPNLEKAAEWLWDRRNDLGLVDEGLVAGWADMTLKSGSVTYTNLCTWKALGDLGWKKEAVELGKAINKYLWSSGKGYYIDWINRGNKAYRDFFVDGNVLAVVWGLADLKKAKRIYEFIDKHGLDTTPTTTCFPALVWWMDLWVMIIFPWYHTSHSFISWGALSTLGRKQINDKARFDKNLISLSKVIVRNRCVPEFVNSQGLMVDTVLYKTERGLAWNAGLFIYLCDRYN